MTYHDFLSGKTQVGTAHGFKPRWMPDFLFDFQKPLVEWAIRKGRAGLFEDCGLGKTPQAFVWAQNVVEETNKPVLLLTYLGVAAQMVREAQKFGVDCVRSHDGKFPDGARIVVANYDRLHYFSQNDFSGAVCDESGCLKHFKAKRTADVTDFLRTIPYRLLCTATAAPNDYVELGTSAEALGEMGFRDMVTKFFKQSTSKDHLGWGRTKYVMKGHAHKDFWRWVCSWSRAIRKPSDIGFDDGPFTLPELSIREHIVEAKNKKEGFLFDMPAVTLEEQREERRRTMVERCEMVAELVNGTGKPAVVWCHLNPEGDLLEKLIPDAVQVSGSDSDQEKEEAFLAFSEGKIRVMDTKPIIGAWGLNWQHCSHETFFPSHSFEQIYQGMRRCWRFGQKNKVLVDIVCSEGERGVLANYKRKSNQADVMFSRTVQFMNDSMSIARFNEFSDVAKSPSWLKAI